MSRAYSLYFSSPNAPNISSRIISEKPIIAFNGVRNSWDIFAINSDFVLFAASARWRAFLYFSANSTSSCACNWASCWAARWCPKVTFKRSSESRSFFSLRFSCVMSVPIDTEPPSWVGCLLIWSQRPSSSSASTVVESLLEESVDMRFIIRGRRPRAIISSNVMPSRVASGGRLYSWLYFELHITRRWDESNKTNDSDMLSIASRRRMPASRLRCFSCSCSLMSTTIPIKCALSRL